MEINSPEQMMAAIKLLMVQMNREQRKQFLTWIKRNRNEMDFKYPQGYKIEVKEKQNETPAAPVIVVPTTELIVPTNHDPNSGILRA